MVGDLRLKNFIRNRTFLYIVIIGVLIVSFAGATYAIFTTTTSQTGTNTITTVSCINLTFSNQSSAINLKYTYPVSDATGKAKTPYSFTLTNNCGAPLSAVIAFEKTSSSTLSSSFVKTYFGTTSSSGTLSYLSNLTTVDAKNGGTAYKLTEDYFAVGASKTYYLRLWLAEEVDESDGAENKTLTGTIIVKTTAKSSS